MTQDKPTKTAMIELIEHMKYFKDYSAFARDTIKKAYQLLEKEKTQIVDARTDGFASTFIMGDPKDRMLVLKGDNETYFTQTYKQ